MRFIVLSTDPAIEQKLLSFSPDNQYIIASDIISLHNGLVRYDIDCILLDKTNSSIWNMDIAHHVHSSTPNRACYYFNPASLAGKYIEIYGIDTDAKKIPFAVEVNDVAKFILGEDTTAENRPYFYAKLTNHQQKLLQYFSSREGKLISFKDMAEYLFGSFTEQHKKTLYTYIHTIRLCIEDNPKFPKHLIRKEKGYYTYV